MRVPHLRLAMLAAVGGFALSGCAYGMYDDGYGYGGYGYGYPRSSVSVGIGYGSGYGGYGYGGYYGGYGYGGYPYGGYYDPFGWYGDYYYPGTGIYVYDRSRNRRVWTDEQRRYWEQRRQRWQSRSGTNSGGENWSGWDRSRWRNRNNSTTTNSTSGNWTRGDRSTWQSRSSVTTTGERVRSSDGQHSSGSHSRERAGEKPQ